MKTLFAELAEANRHINRTWLVAMAHLPLAELDRPQSAFFDTIFGAWNHILVGDQIWMARILGQPAPTSNLRERLCDSMETFRQARETTDADLIRIVAEATNFAQDIVYRNTKGTRFQTPLYQVLAHLFAHQSHHRGQISQMCHERKIAVPDGGLIDFYRSRPA